MEYSVIFWGVRGSIPSPGSRTARVGGNTSCVELRLAGQRILLDGGSGLRQLGVHQGGAPLSAHVLFGHLHWDHIQGVPFFGPLFDPRSQVRFAGPPGLQQALAAQMSGPSFPVTMEVMPAAKSFWELTPGQRLALGDVQLTTAPLNHPGGGLAYRLEADNVAVVYACDTEHPAAGLDSNLLLLAQECDLLIYDAQYLPEEYPGRRGWGHSTFEQGAALALAAGARRLLLTHHDPTRDDLSVFRLEKRAQRLFPPSYAAREGMVVSLKRGLSGTSAGGGADYGAPRQLVRVPGDA